MTDDSLDGQRLAEWVGDRLPGEGEPFTAERYTGLAVSQGGIQTVFKLKQTELNDKIAQFHALVEEHFQGRTLPVMLSYRMRLGIK